MAWRRDAPVLIGDFDLESGSVQLPAGRDGHDYATAVMIVRRQEVPVGTLEVPLDRDGIGPATARRIQQRSWPTPDDIVAEPATVSAIVCTVNRQNPLRRATESILNGSFPVTEVVIVDNSPDGRNARLLDELAKRDARVTPVHCRTRGLSAARNAGAHVAVGEFLAFTDDDILAEPQWLEGLVAALQRPGTEVATGLILPSELETPAQRLCARAGGYGKGFADRVFRIGMPGAGPLFPYQLGTFGSGANIGISAQAFERLGGFDETLGAGTRARGGEDLDLFFRAINAGMTIRYTPKAVIRHTDIRELDDFARQRFGYGVGLSSVLTKLATSGHLKPMANRAVPGLRHLFGATSSKNAQKRGAYPLWLSGLELLGMAYGPVAQQQALRVRKQTRLSRSPAPTDRETPP
jgi:glycosyltransferase involved in cell wall biosynthesis